MYPIAGRSSNQALTSKQHKSYNKKAKPRLIFFTIDTIGSNSFFNIFPFIFLVLFWTFQPCFILLANNLKPENAILFSDTAKYSDSKKGNFGLQATLLISNPPMPDPDQLVTVEGYYTDGDKPIKNAFVEIFKDGIPFDTDYTDDEGYFNLQFLVTGEQEQEALMAGLLQNYPNPFAGQTKISVNAKESGKFMIHDIAGRTVLEKKIDKKGSYELIWGGQNLNGQDQPDGVYLYSFITDNGAEAKKLVKRGTGTGGLSVDYNGTILSYKSEEVTMMRWTKENTTLLEIMIDIYGDTLFTQQGNVGPELITPMPDTIINHGDTLEYNLNDFWYNYQQNIFTTSTMNAWIENDSILKYFGENKGFYEVIVNVQDPLDPELTDEGNFYVEVQNVAPQQTAPIPDQYTLEDDNLIIDFGEYFYDLDDMMYSFPNLQNATYNVNGNVVTFDPDENYNGAQEGIIVEVTDGEETIQALFNWYIAEVNDPPTAINPFSNAYYVNEDETIEIDLWGEIYWDVDNTTLSYPILNLVNATSFETDTSRMITPTPNWFGTITEVEINAYDEEFTATNNPFNVEVIPVNDYPNIINDTVSTPYNTPIMINVLANDNDDLDPDGGIDPNTLTIITQPPPEEGIVEVITGQVKFTPTIGFNGQVTFVYQVYDNGVPPPALSGQATGVVNVGQGNLPPTLNLPDTLYTQEGATVPVELLNLMNSYNDPEGQQGNFEITYQSNPTLALTQILQDSLLFLTYLQQYGNGTSMITIKADDGNGGEDTDNTVLKVEAVNNAPFNTGNFDNYNITQGDSVVVNYVRPLKFDDIDSDFLYYLVNGLGSNATYYQIGDTVLVIKPNENFYGDLLNLTTEANDGELSVTSGLFNIYVAQGNVAPTFTVPDQTKPEDWTGITIINDLEAYVNDPNQSTGFNFAILSQSNQGLINLVLNNEQLNMNYLQPDGSGESDIAIEVTDNGSLTDTAYFKMIIDARCDLTLIIKDLMTDDLLTGQSEFIIGSNNYTSFTGDVTQQINPGTYEIFATNPATIDWTFIWQAYGFIQEAGVFNNVEQRAGPDQTSQVSFDKQDRTLTIYKLMSDFDLYTVQLAIATGPDGETIRFGQQSPDAWFNLNYQTPNSTTVSRVQDLLYNHMPAATNNKLTMTYIEGTVTPAEPYLEMAMDPSFPGPGTNSTSWNANYEITTCSARWPGDQSTSTLWTEMIQAIQNQNDVGISLTFYDGSNWHISDFGKACLKLGYNVDPGTLLYDNSDKSGKNVIDDKKKQLGIFEESSSTGNVEFNYINK